MREYFESYSNLAYNLIGFLGLLPQFEPHNGLVFCLVLQALGVASFTYHWHKTRPIYLFDWWAMNFVVTSITAHVCGGSALAWFTVFMVQIFYGYLLMGRFHVFIEVGAVVIPCLIAIFINRDGLDFFIVLALLLAALYIRSRDEDPTQARFYDSIEHGVWHILTAPLFFIGWFGLDVILKAF